jgi:hypothetical protein
MKIGNKIDLNFFKSIKPFTFAAVATFSTISQLQLITPSFAYGPTDVAITIKRFLYQLITLKE